MVELYGMTTAISVDKWNYIHIFQVFDFVGFSDFNLFFKEKKSQLEIVWRQVAD